MRTQHHGRTARLALAAALLALTAGTGCGLFRKPLPPPLPRREVIQQVRANTGDFRTLVDTDIALFMTVTEDGKRHRGPTFGGHIAFDRALPGLWLSAEKIGRQIFSLKARGMRFWLVLPETREVVTGSARAYAKLPHMIRPDEVQRLFEGPDGLGLTWEGSTMAVEGNYYRFDVRVMGMPYTRVLVDRRRLVISGIQRLDSVGRVIADIRLADYSPTDSALFPHRLQVERPLAGTGVNLRLGSPNLNKPIPPEAFEPTEHTGWRHINLDYQPLSAVEAFSGETE
ncbi:MAG: hypothetical protein R6X33_19200 [Candidatus Brocadiia bacterium]